MKYGLSLLLFGALPIGGFAAGLESSVTAALHAALAKNVDHARDWLDQKDFKSLAQSAGGLQLLAEVTRAKSDDAAWQSALGSVVEKAGQLQTAARGEEDLAKCRTAIESLGSAVKAAAALTPNGKLQSLSRPPAIRPLMLTIDAIQGDAKKALLMGQVEAAKKQAHVLAELGKLVSNSRATEGWSSLAGDFTAAATAAATSNESDPKLVRQHFRAVAERCEACHEKSRTR
jgi:hypothetical protein